MWRAHAWLNDSSKRLRASKNENENFRDGHDAESMKKNARTKFLVT